MHCIRRIVYILRLYIHIYCTKLFTLFLLKKMRTVECNQLWTISTYINSIRLICSPNTTLYHFTISGRDHKSTYQHPFSNLDVIITIWSKSSSFFCLHEKQRPFSYPLLTLAETCNSLSHWPFSQGSHFGPKHSPLCFQKGRSLRVELAIQELRTGSTLGFIFKCFNFIHTKK